MSDYQSYPNKTTMPNRRARKAERNKVFAFNKKRNKELRKEESK